MGFKKDSLENELESGSQVEGIIGFDTGKHYISREHFSISLGGNEIVFTQKLYEFSDERNGVLSINQFLKETSAFPNPVSDIYTSILISTQLLFIIPWGLSK